jgi:DNA-binding NarL/FixJ family response regulator
VTDRSRCPAPRHGTEYAARRRRCICPDARAARQTYRGQPTRSRRLSPGRSPQWLVDERMATTAQLTRWGRSANEIAQRLGVAQRTVVRYRAALREQAAVGQ